MGGMRKCRLSHYRHERVTGCFGSGTAARAAASLCVVSRKTAALPFPRLSEVVAHGREAEGEAMLGGGVKVAKSCFGGRHKCGLGHGSAGKVPVFCQLNRGGKAYAKITPDASSATLVTIVRRKVAPDSIVHSDCWRGHNALDVPDLHHLHINHPELFTDRSSQINRTEDIWSQARRRMRKFDGAPKAQFGLCLQEYEWRFINSAAPAHLSSLKQWIKRHPRRLSESAPKLS